VGIHLYDAFRKTLLALLLGWQPFDHVAIAHQPLTALEQWKAFKHRPLWVIVVNRNMDKRDALLLLSFYFYRSLDVKQKKNDSNSVDRVFLNAPLSLYQTTD